MKAKKMKLLVIALLGFAMLTQTSCKKEEQVVEPTQNQTTTPTTPTTPTDDDDDGTQTTVFTHIYFGDSIQKHLDSIVWINDDGVRVKMDRVDVINDFVNDKYNGENSFTYYSKIANPVTGNGTCTVYAKVNKTYPGIGGDLEYLDIFCSIQFTSGETYFGPITADGTAWTDRFNGQFSNGW